MRWWNAAWTLARESRLTRELPPNPIESDNANGEAGGIGDNNLPEQSTVPLNVKGNLSANVAGVRVKKSEKNADESGGFCILLIRTSRYATTGHTSYSVRTSRSVVFSIGTIRTIF